MITDLEFEMEELYHVAKDDSVVGRVERDQAHDKSILHRSGIVFVVRPDGKILIQNRSPSKRIFPSCYDCSCAFHVTFGESYDEAAKRELREETGITGVLEYLGKFSHYDPPENQIVAVFKCQSHEQIVIDQTEATGANFYSRNEVDRIVALEEVTPWLRDGWKLARDRLV